MAARVVLTLGITGCTTVGPDFVQPKAPVIAQWQEADGAVVSSRPEDQIRWWEAFSDPVLDKLIDVAYQNNYSLKIAGLKVLEARAQVGIAVGSLYPQVQQANGSVNYTSGSKNAANTKAGDLGFLEYNVGWELIDQFLAALRSLPEVQAERESAGAPALDAQLALDVAGKPIALVELRKAIYPRDVRQLVWRIRDLARQQPAGESGGEPLAVPVESISAGAKELLRAERVGYYDSGGSLYMSARGAYLHVDRPPPKSLSRSMRTLYSSLRQAVRHHQVRVDCPLARGIEHDSGFSPGRRVRVRDRARSPGS